MEYLKMDISKLTILPIQKISGTRRERTGAYLHTSENSLQNSQI